MAQFNSLLVTGDSRFLNPINGNARNGVYTVIGTQTASTGSWTGVIPVPALYDGLKIAYYLPYNGSGNATLNLTLSTGSTTGAINCYYRGNTRLTTHYSAGDTIMLTYFSAGSIKISGTATTDNRWIAGQNFTDGNTNTWRNIKVAGTEKLGTATSTGAVDFVNGTNSTVAFNATGSTITFNVTSTDSYSSTGTVPTTGKAVAAALGTLDGSITGSAGAAKTLTAFSQTDGKVTATFGNIAIANTQVSGLGTASTKDVPASGNASTTQVVLGSDTRLSDSRTPTSHTHGNIQNGGTLQTNDITIANGDKLVVTDSSDSSKVARASISFDGSTTNKALTPKGTFESFATTDTNTHRPIKMNGTEILGNNTTALDLKNGQGIGLANSSGAVTFSNSAGNYTVIGTQTASTGSWTGNIPIPALYDGLSIDYYLPYDGSGNATLNLTLSNGTTTGAKNCYITTGRLTTHYGAGRVIHMTYWSAGSISIKGTATTDDRWICDAYYDTNDGHYYVRRVYACVKSGSNKIFPYTILMQLSDGRWESIVTSSSTGTSKARNTHGFLPDKVLLMYANATYNENDNVGNYNIWEQYGSLIDHRYSFNTANNATSGTTAYKPVYLVGTITDGLFYLDATKWWTQTLPSTADGKVYIYIGDAYDYYRMVFTGIKAIYKYTNGKIRTWGGDADTVSGLTVQTAVPASAVFTDTKVTQTATSSTSADYEVLFSATADNTTRTEGARKNKTLLYNPSTNHLRLNNSSDINVVDITGGSDVNQEGAIVLKDSTGAIEAVNLYSSSGEGTIWLNDTSNTTKLSLSGNGSISCLTINSVTVGSSPKFTDEKVLQSSGADANVAYKMLFEDDSTSGTVTAGTRKCQYITFNPSSCTLAITGRTPSGGNLHVANIVASYINGDTVPADPKFSDMAVQQLMSTANNADYKILYEDDSTTTATNTSGTRKATTFKYNPYFDRLTVGSISVSTPTYTLTKSSGTWTAGSVTAKRCGNVVHMKVIVKGTGTAVASGSDGFIGTITAGSGAALPALTITLTSYVNNFVICGYIDTTGKIWVRPIGSGNYTAASGANIEMDGTFICV